MKVTRIILVLALLATVTPVFTAEGPPYMNYQGVLRDSGDNPLDGSFDMVFRYLGPSDVEIMVEEHLAGGTGGVTVSGGMFNVKLGTGVKSDGAGPGTYVSLYDVFRDHQEVYLEVEVDGETLSPSVRVFSTAYALNSSYLEGLDSGSLLRSDASDAYTLGTLTFGPGTVLDLDGTLNMDGAVTKATTDKVVNFNADRLDDLDSSSFSLVGHGHAGSEISGPVAEAGNADLLDGYNSTDFSKLGLNNTFTGANFFTRIPVNNSLYGGGIAIDAPTATLDYTLFGVGVAGQEKFRVDAEGDVFSKGWVSIDGTAPLLRLRDATGANSLTQLYANDNSNFTYLYDWQNGRYLTYSGPAGIGIGTNSPDSNFDVTIPSLRVTSTSVGLDGRIYMDYDGPQQSQSIYFYNNTSPSAEHLTWDETQNRFEFSDALAIARIDSGSTVLTPVSYNRFGTGTAEDSGLGDSNDAYFTDRVEIDGTLLLNNTLYLSDGSSSPLWQWIYFWGGSSFSEYINFSTWSGSQFTMSDNLQVDGDLSVSGAKSFVQNHPYDPDLSVLYVALEGDEAGTYTRGSGRLVDGEARIPLGETFAWVTNPEIGLTAHVTPRSPDAVVYVESVSTDELVVRNVSGFADDAAFDYIVHGIRIGYEEFQTVQPRATQAPVPSEAYYQRKRDEQPELQRHTAAARFTSMQPLAARAAGGDSSPARVLRESIGEFDPDLDDPNREARLAGMDEAEAPRGHVSTPVDAAAPQGPAPVDALAETDSPTGFVEDGAAREDTTIVPRSMFAISRPVEAGDLLTLDPERPGLLVPATTARDPGVVGIAADAPVDVDGELRVALVETNYAVVKVDAGYGEIRPGDLLTSSFTSGHAMRATEIVPGTIVGKALEPLETGTGLIKVLVMPR